MTPAKELGSDHRNGKSLELLGGAVRCPRWGSRTKGL